MSATYHIKVPDTQLLVTLNNGDSQKKDKVYKAAQELADRLGTTVVMIKRDITVKESTITTVEPSGK